MESEKVKEIKECLQSCNDDKMACYDCKYYEKCEKILTKNNILTLINELETKNEVLCVELSRYTEHCVEMKNGTLNQFAERLKGKSKSTYDFFQCPTKENKVISFDDIDETLKEFINKGDDKR